MSTPTPTTPKGPRNPRRTRKNSKAGPPANTTFRDGSSTQNQNQNHSTPPPARLSPPSPSPGEALINTVSEGASQKKKGKPVKKNITQSSNPSPMTNGTTIGHGHSASQPNILSTLKDGTHYAGPTFHASPAPSALPIPTFFSKSVPDGGAALGSPEGGSQVIGPLDHTPTKPKTAVAPPQSTEEIPSPLEFLFKSAKGAKVTNRPTKSVTKSMKPSPPQPNLQSQPRSQAQEVTPGAIFPLELESPDNRRMAIGPSFATPYKDRINALRSASSPSKSNDAVPLDEDQRKAKTEALKDLLLNPRPQRPSSASPKVLNDSNLLGGSRSWTAGNAMPFARHASGPPTLVPSEEPKISPKGRSPGSGSIAHQYLSSVCNGTQASRTPSSNLRRELSSTSPTDRPPFSTEGNQSHLKRSQTYVNLTSPTPNRVHPHANPDVPSPRSGSTRTNPIDAKQMEADLRRILKLDSNH
ncbi:hypothetical protein BDDG_05851 [Blastomyces dermatitidis ATCC 18188]|uniref:Proteophosphoglycan 5 n=1 Tax=Ajellomyces dermatitidis (strain ATCC 18188 / CBS 674.68) TaxID=653446 RepID=F2TI57_AJEDA|nr:hypothetical protein BDDG_05851 [Blastomyces dermatitidis ATCC 18188]